MAGWIIFDVGGLPEGYMLLTVVGCLVVGMFFSTLPFLLDYRAELKREEINEFQNIAEQLQSLTQLEEHIRHATGQWQAIQDHCVSTVQDAGQIADGMSKESARFAEVMQTIDVTEKEHLRVELEKLRRSEREWLQSVVRVLDHVFALHKAALQSGQPKLIQQIAQFQHAVTDVMRRMGLNQHAAEVGTAYDEEHHQVLNEEHQGLTTPCVAETLAPGFTFQGRLVRKPLVQLVEKEQLPTPEHSEATQLQPAADPDVAETAPMESQEASSVLAPEPDVEADTTEPSDTETLPEEDAAAEASEEIPPSSSKKDADLKEPGLFDENE